MAGMRVRLPGMKVNQSFASVSEQLHAEQHCVRADDVLRDWSAPP